MDSISNHTAARRPAPLRGKAAWAALALVAIATVSGSGQVPRDIESRPGSRTAAAQIVKVGKKYVNIRHIVYVEEAPKNGLQVHFVGDRLQTLYLGGDEAEALRRYLDAVASPLPAPAADGDKAPPASPADKPH
jgi:hypothetical protein